MRAFEDLNFEQFDKGTFQDQPQIEQPLQVEQPLQIEQPFNESQIVSIAQQFTQPIEQNQIEQTQSFYYPESYDIPTTNDLTQNVIEQPAQNYQFQLLPNEQITSEANKMLDYPAEETNYQQGYAIEDLPPIDIVDVEPPKTDLEQFPNVVNDIDQKTPVTVVVTSGQTGEQLTVQTTPENVQNVIDAAQVADNAIANQTSGQQTATTTSTTDTTEKTSTTDQNAEDLLWGYPKESVYLVGGVAVLGGLFLLSAFSSEE